MESIRSDTIFDVLSRGQAGRTTLRGKNVYRQGSRPQWPWVIQDLFDILPRVTRTLIRSPLHASYSSCPLLIPAWPLKDGDLTCFINSTQSFSFNLFFKTLREWDKNGDPICFCTNLYSYIISIYLSVRDRNTLNPKWISINEVRHNL